MDMTFEEKNERYRVVKELLQFTNYISSSELIQLEEIFNNCQERYKNLKPKGVWYERGN